MAPTSRTTWPNAAITNETKTLIDRFFSLMDNPSDGVGEVLANEVFTVDGVLKAAAKTFVGHKEISVCRQHAWDTIKERKHTVLKVYAHDSSCSDIMLLGSVDMALANGNNVSMEFAARIELTPPTTEKQKIKVYEVFADPTVIAKAAG